MGIDYTQPQIQIAKSSFTSRIFVRGLAGTGKTTAASARLSYMLQQGIAAESILIITPQRSLAAPFKENLAETTTGTGGQVTYLTVGGLARRMVGLFWPLISAEAGFSKPDQTPTFLTLETVQYYIARIIQPLLDKGYFSSITINRNRLYSQIIDNLNKAAVVGFSHLEIADRLKSAWNGEPGQLRVYEDAQYCANLFREYCLEKNLLDYSLQMEVFLRYIWPNNLCRNYLITNYRHLIVDNIEEDTPAAHDLYSEWLPECASALLIFDEIAGYRKFLGANPETAAALRSLCDEEISLSDSFVMKPEINNLRTILFHKITKTEIDDISKKSINQNVLEFEVSRFFPGMLDWVCEKIVNLIHEQNIQPGNIVVLAPLLSK